MLSQVCRDKAKMSIKLIRILPGVNLKRKYKDIDGNYQIVNKRYKSFRIFIGDGNQGLPFIK